MMLDFEISELARRLANMIQLGKVVATDYEPNIPRAKVKIGELSTAWLPLMSQRAGEDRSWWPVEVGEQVILIAPSGELTQAIIIGALNQNKYPAISKTADCHCIEYGDGTKVSYDRKNHCVDLTLTANGKIQLTATKGITTVGSLIVDGDISASGDVSDGIRSMSSDRTLYNQHTHAGVQSGESVTQTAIPKQ